MAEVLLKHVGKRFGKTQVVSDISLQIQDGEFVVLVGPSGCGKSTTLRMIAGLEEISEGDLFIGGRKMNLVHPKDRDIAMVFQSYALYPHMTVLENISFGLKMRKVKKEEIQQRVGQAAEILGLTELLSRKPKELSGGQRQRVAMGRAIVRKPQVFLFDEPLSNLDAKLRVQMRAEITKLHRRLGTTIVYVTHDQVEAMTLADRMVVMDRGKVQQVGTPMEVFEHPHNRFVAGFIGSPAMNFIPCSLSAQGTLQGTGFELQLASAQRMQTSGKSGPMELGVRPNHLKIAKPEQSAGTNRLLAQVEVKEPMGNETFIYASMNQQMLTIREDGQGDCKIGDTVEILLDLDKSHLFDASTGAIIY